MNILILTTLLFWFLHILQRNFYSLYFWQLKEYRLDRFLEEAKRNKGVLLPKASLLAFVLLLLLCFLPASFQPYFLFLFYSSLGLYSLCLFIEEEWSFPEFTKKMILLSAFTLFLIPPSILILKETLLFLLIFEILFPLFIFFCIIFIQIPTFFIKNWIKEKAKKKREEHKDLIVIGITGSYGKSSTKEFLYTILSSKYNVLKTEGNVNTDIGVANTILGKLKKDHQVFICEMAAYKKGEIKEICEIAKPKIGILIGINEQHLALFGSQDNIIKAKFELIDSLPEDGAAIFNGNNDFIVNRKSQIANRNLKSKIFSSTKEKANIWAQDIKSRREEVSFKVFTQDGDMADFKVNLLGAQNVENILLATACAKELKMSLGEIAKACKKIQPWQGGIKLKKGKNNLNIIDATYSANPNGLMSHLDYLKIWFGKKIIVMPCLIELGKASKEVHKRIGERIGGVCDLAIITTKERLKEIRDGAAISSQGKLEVLFIEDPKEIFRKIKAFSGPGDVILLESRVPQKLINLLIE